MNFLRRQTSASEEFVTGKLRRQKNGFVMDSKPADRIKSKILSNLESSQVVMLVLTLY